MPPLPDLDLEAPVHAYRTYVQQNLPRLLAAARHLAADVDAGDLIRARTDWLPAHLDYARLGAAYASFDDFDTRIDGTPDGLPGGIDDPSWTGFSRIEYGLWHGQSAAQVRPFMTGLVADIRGLIRDFPSEDADPADLPLRSHEILENALESQLTGAADFGSGTTLATLDANIDGTEAVLGTLTTLIAVRQPALLAAINHGIGLLRADLDACRDTNGDWTAVSALTQRQHQQLDGDLGALLEQLAVVPNLLQERTSA